VSASFHLRSCSFPFLFPKASILNKRCGAKLKIYLYRQSAVHSPFRFSDALLASGGWWVRRRFRILFGFFVSFFKVNVVNNSLFLALDLVL
jgi:hypothetical protein